MENVFIALDFPEGKIAKEFIEKNELHGASIKIGMELFYKEGPQIVEYFKERGHRIFLDLKLYDIPNTVKRAMENLARLEVDIVNVHASGGGAMIQAAKEGLLKGAGSHHCPSLIAVTVLTSFSEEQFQKDLKIKEAIHEYAPYLASLAKENGAEGVVCSVHESDLIKEVCGEEFLTVTPGIRLADSAKDDQERVATPAIAREKNSSIIVVGRSITKASHPKEAYERVVKEWTN